MVGISGSIRTMTHTVTFIGVGEAALTFARDDRWRGLASGYDIKLEDPSLEETKRAEFKSAKIKVCKNASEPVAAAEVVISLVTADQAVVAAREAAKSMQPSSIFLDMNSVSPGSKRAAADAIRASGAKYSDIAIMAPVQPKAMDVPILVSGPDAELACTHLTGLGFTSVRAVGTDIGQASAIKMIRSVMIKGIEALTAECLLAADAAGVTEEVITSLGADWVHRANYNFERMLVHGERRAAEMEEVCQTLLDLEIEPLLTRGTVARQQQLGVLGHKSPPASLKDKLDTITSHNKAIAS